MAIRVAVNHLTEYRYDRLVTLGPQIIRLRPAPHCRTPIHAYSLQVEPSKHFINWQQDPFGNYLARLVFPDETRRLRVEVDVVSEMTVINPFDFFVESYAREFPFAYDEQLNTELAPYLEIRESGPVLREYLSGISRRSTVTVDFLVDLNGQLQKDLGYVIRMEPGIQKCDETLTKASGSCRDSGWLLVQILRHLGLAARFVSGYLVQLAPDVKSLDGPSGPEEDFTDLHAWAEVYVPGAGWLGLDPTSGLFAGEGHIPLACTPDPVSAAPVTGVVSDAKTEFYFHNEVTRVHEDPRVTRPYTDRQWQAVERLANRVERELRGQDVRLTMGGEPTFVSIDDMDGAQWNTAALGEEKRKLAGDLLRRLQRRFAPGGLLHYGQGKWYPGEPLPRWALSCLWRKDGVPLWTRPALMADEAGDQGATPEQANRFMQALAKRLGLSGRTVRAGYEDTFYYLWKKGALPTNVDPIDNRLDDLTESRQLARIFERGLHEVVGYALPLKWEGEFPGGHWRSGEWTFRHPHMYLLPGDSPMGYRLPLDSLPWSPPEEREPLLERCTFEPRPPLEQTMQWAPHVMSPSEAAGDVAGKEGADVSGGAGDLVRTTLCVQPRDGHIQVFLPPLTHLEHYLALVGAVEETAAELGLPVLMEGYEPPGDPRLLRLSVTPDPGVIEVNVHPAASWSELELTTRVLYEEARLARLGTEKFMLDGRHTGTGGGNHVTIGGPTPADSPVLRRPDLLRSLVSYWQNHPSLSYLFSGLFIGPTSQAPRVDEGRDEGLYELEIAFQQMPDGDTPQPWLVDRLMRNLLVDVTGNTHRTEFCIDKLYSPDSASGRLGLVEFRAFEMPPHQRMSMVQMLFLRALIAWFWREPYRRPPVRWGTELHDRFLLPHFVWQDFADVIRDLGRAGIELDLTWFEPFFEFRFPHYGSVMTDEGIEIELRTAIEPWHVLGEEVSRQGTARFVDSSTERLQVKVRGMQARRYVVACNGRRLPLRPTGVRGEHVAGIRYKAWQPPSGLHPTIGVHAPLSIDLVDAWNRQAVANFSYYVAHPGGRHYETFPVNAYEAESRRIARFRQYGLRPGPMDPPPEEPSGDFPYTLDLRYARSC